MSTRTYKMTKLVGESTKSIEDAVEAAVATSASKVRGLTWAHIVDLRANLAKDGSVERWQTTVEVAFRVEDDS